ncbi:MAG: response regulator [Acidobacteria bacterium]|nr:response regulator [Acidobacteriota bacterium]
MHLSLRTKFYLLVAVLVFAVGGVLSTYFVRQLRDTVHQGLEARARSLAENLSRNSEYGLLLRSRELLEGPIRSLLADDMIQAAMIVDMDGKPLAKTARPGVILPDLIEIDERNSLNIIADPEHSSFVLTTPVYTGDVKGVEGGEAGSAGERRRVGTVYLQVSYAQAAKAAQRLSLAALGLTAALVVVCFLLGIFLVRYIVNPLVALEAGTRHLAQGDLSFRVTQTGQDELGRLASSFNAMAEDLQMSRRELGDHNKNLELKVAEKTQILSLANRRLEEMNRLKSEFLANMSHELRTPLNAILGFTDLMIDGQCGELTEQQSTYLQTVYTSGQHLLNLINSILDLSKIEAGKMEVFPEEFYVQDVVEFALSLVESQAAKKQINLHKAIAAEVKTVVADQTKVQQILQNLLTNAVKFTPENGRIGIVVTQDNNGVLFAVSDTGVGISKEDQQKIFSAFTQVDATYTRTFEGTGLGLSLVDHYVRMHRGKVWVESEMGKGSTFYVRLPRATSSGLAPNADAKAKAPPVETILVIEDDPMARSIMKQYLEPTGCKVHFATNKEEARKAIKTVKPSLITLDITLGKESGWDLLSEVKSDPKTANIPVMVISAVDERGIGCAFGAEDYLVKPVDRQQLLARLQAMGLASPDLERQIQVLVVDDHPEARLLLRKILEGQNMKVVEAENGKEAIQAAHISIPDLILLDLMMPDVSGFEVLQDLRALPATRNVPVIVVSAKDITAEENGVLSGNVAAIFRKSSLSGAEFAREVRRVLDVKEQTQEAVNV